MKVIIVLILAFSHSVFGQAVLAQFICGNGAQSTLVEAWKETRPHRYCSKANCTVSGSSFTRTRCVNQFEDLVPQNAFFISNTDSYTSPSVRNETFTERVTLAYDHQCFQSCRPERGMMGTKAGFQRRTCVDCFKRLTPEVRNSISYPELGGLTLERQTKCWYACHDQEGQIKNERILSESCKQCIGLGGFMPESFQYLRTIEGQCFEIDHENRRWPVNASMCSNRSNLLTTQYEIYKTLFELATGRPGNCVERDDKTWGLIYRVRVAATNCEGEHVNQSDRNIAPAPVTIPYRNGAAGSSAQ